MTEAARDMVNHPPHYKRGEIECIDALRCSMSAEQYQGYLKGNVQKYLWRIGCKGPALEDAKKAQWYLNKLVEAME